MVGHLYRLLIANQDININFPELKNKENCYLGKNPDDYLEIFQNIINENNLNDKIRINFKGNKNGGIMRILLNL